MGAERANGGENGQALAETALTLPLTLFLVLGTMQLFLLFQGRVMAQYAAARATRAGSLKSGACDAMVHTAVAALLPTFTPTRTPAELAAAFRLHLTGKYDFAQNAGHTESIVWMIRQTTGAPLTLYEEETFDLASTTPRTLGVRMIFWYPMRIPFANWVMSAIVRANYGLGNLVGANPLMPTQRQADWSGGKTIDPLIGSELVRRAQKSPSQYVMPIQVTYSMRMMTPARRSNLGSPICTPYP